MSVTTLLIPVPEEAAEALVAGEPAATVVTSTLIAEGAHLRRLVATVDLIREELHTTLYPLWTAGQPPSAEWFRAVVGLFRRQGQAVTRQGYDPFVHLFGRSLPVDGPTARQVAEELRSVLDEGPERGLERLALMLERLDLRAASLLRRQPLAASAKGWDDQVRELAHHATVDEVSPAALHRSLTQLARLFCQTQPIWRLDGQSLTALFATIGMSEAPGGPAPLFEELAYRRPAIEPLREHLAARLVTHQGTGAFLSSGDVKRCLGAIRLRRAILTANATQDATPLIALRHLRLLEEALCYSELTNSGLLEAAGVESNSSTKAP